MIKNINKMYPRKYSSGKVVFSYLDVDVNCKRNFVLCVDGSFRVIA